MLSLIFTASTCQLVVSQGSISFYSSATLHWISLAQQAIICARSQLVEGFLLRSGFGDIFNEWINCRRFKTLIFKVTNRVNAIFSSIRTVKRYSQIMISSQSRRQKEFHLSTYQSQSPIYFQNFSCSSLALGTMRGRICSHGSFYQTTCGYELSA